MVMSPLRLEKSIALSVMVSAVEVSLDVVVSEVIDVLDDVCELEPVDVAGSEAWLLDPQAREAIVNVAKASNRSSPRVGILNDALAIISQPLIFVFLFYSALLWGTG